jgi:hypothetical protein
VASLAQVRSCFLVYGTSCLTAIEDIIFVAVLLLATILANEAAKLTCWYSGSCSEDAVPKGTLRCGCRQCGPLRNGASHADSGMNGVYGRVVRVARELHM